MWQTEASVRQCHGCKLWRGVHSGNSKATNLFTTFAPGCQDLLFSVADSLSNSAPSFRPCRQVNNTHSAARSGEDNWKLDQELWKKRSFELQTALTLTFRDARRKKRASSAAQKAISSSQSIKVEPVERQDSHFSQDNPLLDNQQLNLHQKATEAPSTNGPHLQNIPALNLERRAQTVVKVQQAANDSELLAAAWLRAEVYADGLPYTCFIDSYKKQFADQEFGSLAKRTRAQSGRHLRCCCLVAIDTEAHSRDTPASEYVVGTLDASLKQLMPGERIPGEVNSTESVAYDGKRPVTKARKYAYISNLCVSEHARRKGVACLLMAAATQVVREWGDLDEVFCHVDVENKGAQRLYKKLGYEKRGEVTVQENGSKAHVSLQRILLLRASLI